MEDVSPLPLVASGINIQPTYDELLRNNLILREDLQSLRRKNLELEKKLLAAAMGSETERQNRRAALNLMEDAIHARQAEQIENAERRKAEARLKEADIRKDEFLATLAHELRNPLAPIRTAIQILRHSSTQSEKSERLCEMLGRQVNHMVRLVDDLMEISRITRGKINLVKQQVELGGIIKNAIEASLPALEAAHHELIVNVPSEEIFLDGDSVRLVQVVTNLLNNAAKYTDANGRVELAVKLEESTVSLCVSDNGVGIRAEMLPKIFELFTQVDKTLNRSQGGLGIGLSLVKCLVQGHGGTIAAHSDGPGYGSNFIVTLPVSTSPPTTHIETRNVISSNIANHRILIVDDNEDAAVTLSTLLDYSGVKTAVAHNGFTALNVLKPFEPSVMLIDIGMPGMDGIELARRIQLEDRTPKIILVALTGWGQVEHRRRTQEAGFDYHLVKPVDIEALQGLLALHTTKQSSSCVDSKKDKQN